MSGAVLRLAGISWAAAALLTLRRLRSQLTTTITPIPQPVIRARGGAGDRSARPPSAAIGAQNF